MHRTLVHEIHSLDSHCDESKEPLVVGTLTPKPAPERVIETLPVDTAFPDTPLKNKDPYETAEE